VQAVWLPSGQLVYQPSLGQDGAAVSLGLGVAGEAAGQCAVAYTVVTTSYSGRQLSASADAGVHCVTVSDIGD
jgi:hypothetical protein